MAAKLKFTIVNYEPKEQNLFSYEDAGPHSYSWEAVEPFQSGCRGCALTSVRHCLHCGSASITRMVHNLGQCFSKSLVNRLSGWNVPRLIYHLKGSSVARFGKC